MGFITFVILAICFCAAAATIYYCFMTQQQEELPLHTPTTTYVQQVPVQQVTVAAPPVAVYAAPPQPNVYGAPAYAPQPAVVYGQAPAQAYAAGPGPAPAPSGGGMSGASVAVGAAAGLAGGLLVGGLIAEASHANDSAPPPGYDYCAEDDVYAGDF
jgi:hypothetical protein